MIKLAQSTNLNNKPVTWENVATICLPLGFLLVFGVYLYLMYSAAQDFLHHQTLPTSTAAKLIAIKIIPRLPKVRGGFRLLRTKLRPFAKL